MKYKKGRGELEMIFGGIFFVVIMVILISSNVFSQIISAFNVPAFGGFGLLLGILFILMIIVGIATKIFGK